MSRAARLTRHELVPAGALAAMLVAFLLLPAFSADASISSFNFYNAIQAFAALGLVALALGLTMIAGEFDLSVPGAFGFGGMVAVLTSGGSPLLGILLAVLLAALVGLVQGIAIGYLGIGSMPVTLGGYLVFVGLVEILGHSESVPFEDFAFQVRLDEPILEVLSIRSIVTLAVFAAAAVVIGQTRWGRDLRAIGGSRRAARTSGVRVGRVLTGTFVASAAIAALGGALLAFSLATATPDLAGPSRLILAATAALLGGIALTGGRGSAVGIAAGVMTLSLLEEGLAVLAAPTYVSSLVTGALLLVATAFAAPHLGRWWRELKSGWRIEAKEMEA
jgi:ribose/xylose/arabinose/galactoside ABC-type transport system permease subunit